jgi:hypothetical protein
MVTNYMTHSIFLDDPFNTIPFIIYGKWLYTHVKRNMFAQVFVDWHLDKIDRVQNLLMIDDDEQNEQIQGCQCYQVVLDVLSELFVQ